MGKASDQSVTCNGDSMIVTKYLKVLKIEELRVQSGPHGEEQNFFS